MSLNSDDELPMVGKCTESEIYMFILNETTCLETETLVKELALELNTFTSSSYRTSVRCHKI